MSKDTGPWGKNENISPWGENSEKLKKNKVIDFSTVEHLKNNDGFDFKPTWIILGVIILWLLSGFYQIQPSEQGVVTRFGAYVYTTDAGLHYHLPYPIENVVKVNTTRERSINLGVMEEYRNKMQSFTESHMLTGDENIVDINLTIVWRIKDAKDYLFSMRSPDTTVQVAAQSVLREIVGQSEMQPIITGDRGKVEDETKTELQKVLDEFQSGIEIVRVKLQKADPPKQVVDAFNEVQRAKADMERFKNEAEAYRNEIIPKARGEAVQKLQDAQAYQAAVVNKAKGEAERFNSVYNAYLQGKEVTATRMYLETIENIVHKSNKIILDPSAKGGNVLPLLPLNSVTNKQ
ncbi:MAG: FtsH protease activity modulator HflK [Alphaproteobacteria bacterium]|nr:FtsH protease activity modulator HflK [Alphaproteobacteria bacterium]